MFHSKPKDTVDDLLSPDMEKEGYICSLTRLSGAYLYTNEEIGTISNKNKICTTWGRSSHIPE